MTDKAVKLLRKTGPGIIVAATGLGAGDIVAAAVAGALFGTVVLWAVLLGALLKFCLNEGIARWQLVTGKTLLEGWIDYLPRVISWYFLVYLLLWSFMVAGALMAATGLAAHAIFPGLSVAWWGVIHSLVAVLIVLQGGYRILENLMKFFIGLMFVTTLVCAVLVMPPLGEIFSGLLVPVLPANSFAYVLGIIGGVGGSVTIMSYGYWMREAGMKERSELPAARVDLAVAYTLTALFGIAIIVVTAGIRPEVVAGNDMALAVADHLQLVIGDTGKWIFLIGFYGAVFSSMIGVWHGVPYLFADFVYHLQKPAESVLDARQSISKSRAYRLYLVYISLLPMLLLALNRPVWVVVIYAVTGAFFMPLLAALLLHMNSKAIWLGDFRNTWKSKTLLLVCLLLFGYLLADQVSSLI
ncbi:MAG: Nramp family divalent metal transporter [Pseudohongiellaceae bacterium]